MAVLFPGGIRNLMVGSEALGRPFLFLLLWLEAKSLISDKLLSRNSDEVCIHAAYHS